MEAKCVKLNNPFMKFLSIVNLHNGTGFLIEVQICWLTDYGILIPKQIVRSRLLVFDQLFISSSDSPPTWLGPPDSM